MLACYVNDKKNNWAEFLPLLQFAYNSSVHATTKFSPFELTYGRQPRLPLDLLTHSAKLDLYLSMGSYAEHIQTQLAIAYEKVAENMINLSELSQNELMEVACKHGIRPL